MAARKAKIAAAAMITIVLPIALIMLPMHNVRMICAGNTIAVITATSVPIPRTLLTGSSGAFPSLNS